MKITRIPRAHLALMVLSILLLCATELPAAASPVEIAYRLQKRYHSLSSLRFSFTQKTSGQMAGRPKTGKGNGLFYKSGKEALMRWNYLSPEQQVVLSDGKTVSMYFESLNQMIVSSVDAARTDVLFSFFTGQGMLEDNFIILAAEPEMALPEDDNPDNLSILQLVPRAQDQIRSIHLYISEDQLIRRIDLLDYFDTRTVINLSAIEVDPLAGLDRTAIDGLFRFTPPAGTEIIRQ